MQKIDLKDKHIVIFGNKIGQLNYKTCFLDSISRKILRIKTLFFASTHFLEIVIEIYEPLHNITKCWGEY